MQKGIQKLFKSNGLKRLNSQMMTQRTTKQDFVPENSCLSEKIEIKETKREIPVDHKVMSDLQIIDLLKSKIIAQHKLEEILGDKTRAVKLRRVFFSSQLKFSL